MKLTIIDAFNAATGTFVLSPSNLYAAAADLINSGITPGNLTQLIGILESGCNSQSNSNKSPKTAVYPKKGSSDAPYSLTESKLRAAIHIPSTFTYGKKPPVILVPGTGTTGCFSFTGNFIPLLTGVSYADIVWLNIPEYLLDDVQVNAVRRLESRPTNLTQSGIRRVCHQLPLSRFIQYQCLGHCLEPGEHRHAVGAEVLAVYSQSRFGHDFHIPRLPRHKPRIFLLPRHGFSKLRAVDHTAGVQQQLDHHAALQRWRQRICSDHNSVQLG